MEIIREFFFCPEHGLIVNISKYYLMLLMGIAYIIAMIKGR